MADSEVRLSRIRFLGLLILLTMIGYVWSLYDLQVIKGEIYRRRSQNISQRSRKITAQRGEIYDRHATVPMVLNIDSFAVDITPGEIPVDAFSTVSARLAVLLGITQAQVEQRVPASIRRSFQTVETDT